MADVFCYSLYQIYRASLVGNIVAEWTPCALAALEEVRANSAYMSDGEVTMICNQVEEILAAAKELRRVAGNKSSWFYARRETEEFVHQARLLKRIARGISARAQLREENGNRSRGPSVIRSFDKQSLLARVFGRFNQKETKSLDMLADVVDAWTKGLETSTEDSERGGTHQCQAHHLLESAIHSTTPNEPTVVSREVQFRREIQAMGQVERARQVCTCRSNSLEVPNSDHSEPPPPYSEVNSN